MRKMPWLRYTSAALAVACALGASGTASAATTWITVGDKALAVMKKAAPRAQILSSRQVPVTVPETVARLPMTTKAAGTADSLVMSTLSAIRTRVPGFANVIAK